MSDTPQLNFQIVNLTGNGYPCGNNEAFQNLLDNAISGGEGTNDYLDHLLLFANLADYLSKQGESAYTTSVQPDGSLQSAATDGVSTIALQLQLAEQPPSAASATAADGSAPAVSGMAIITLSQPAPTLIYKIINLGIALIEIPAGFVVTQALWQAVAAPLLQKLTQYVQTTIENWAEVEIGDDVDGLGDVLADTAADAAVDVGEDAVEVVAEGVACEVAVDLSAAVPPLAVLGLLIAVPMIIKDLEKNFVLHFEIDNGTNYDFNWSIPYMDEGTLTAQPSATVIPKMGRAVDQFGDKTLKPVMFQANYSSMNSSGFSGIGFVVNLEPVGVEGQSIAAVISIPWLAKNVIWLGDVPNSPDWPAIYQQGAKSPSVLNVNHGNMKLYAEMGIDATSGNHDEYHCVLRIVPI